MRLFIAVVLVQRVGLGSVQRILANNTLASLESALFLELLENIGLLLAKSQEVLIDKSARVGRFFGGAFDAAVSQ